MAPAAPDTAGVPQGKAGVEINAGAQRFGNGAVNDLPVAAVEAADAVKQASPAALEDAAQGLSVPEDGGAPVEPQSETTGAAVAKPLPEAGVKLRLCVTEDGSVAVEVEVGADRHGTPIVQAGEQLGEAQLGVEAGPASAADAEKVAEVGVKLRLCVTEDGSVAVEAHVGGADHETIRAEAGEQPGEAQLAEGERHGNAEAEDRPLVESAPSMSMEIDDRPLEEQLEEAKAQVGSLQREVFALREEHRKAAWQLNKCNSAKQMDSTELQEAKAQVEALQSEVFELREEHRKAAWQLRSAKQDTGELRAARERIADLEAQLAQGSGAEVVELKQLKQRMEEQGQALTGIVLEKQKLEARLGEATNFAKELDAALGDANETIKSLKPSAIAEIASVRKIMQGAFEDAGHAASMYEDEVATLKAHVAKAKQESRTAIAALQEYRQYVEHELTDITDQLLTLQERERQHELASEGNSKAMEELRMSLETAEQRCSDNARRVQALEAEAECLRTRGKDDTAMIDKAAEEAAAAGKREESLRAEIERQTAEIARLNELLRRQAQEAEAISGDLRPRLQLAQAELEQARLGEAKATAKMKAALDAVRHMEVDRDKLLTNLKVIEGEVKALTNALGREQDASSKARSDASSAHQRRRAAEQTLSRLQESDKEHKADLKRQARLLSEANAEVEQWKAESDDWRMEATQLLVQVKVATQEP
eukprot:jgi/Tetstr1/437285/TSEL_026014.t1